MKNTTILFIFFFVVFIANTNHAEAENENHQIFVSPSGKDSNQGTKTSPFQTIEKAKDKVRQILSNNLKGDITIYLREGTYPVLETIIFDYKDSGNENTSIIWKAFKDETPIISGGKKIINWKEDINGIWKASLTRDKKLRQLYVNGKPASLAKYKASIKGRGSYGKFCITGNEEWALKKGKESAGVLIKKSDFISINHPEDLEISHRTTFTTNRINITSISDEGDMWALVYGQPLASIAKTQGWGTKLSDTADFSIYNAKEFLTDPGEFYFDRFNKILYYKPRIGENISESNIIVPEAECLIKIEGKDNNNCISNLTFEGIAFANTSWQMMNIEDSYGASSVQANSFTVKYGKTWHDEMYQNCDLPAAAIEVNSARNITFERNIFINNASTGLNIQNDASSIHIVGNVFQNIGGSALNVGHPQHVYIGKENGDNEGFGPYNIDNSRDKWSEGIEGLCENITISNNLIKETGLEHFASVSIMVYFGHGVKIRNNEISNAPYSGISLGWGWEEWDGTNDRSNGKPSLSLRNNSVSHNKISNVLQILNDGGGIYILAKQVPNKSDNNPQEWTMVNNNYLYNFGGDTRAGIHPDNGTQYIIFKNNVFNNIPWSLIKVNGYARKANFRVENNYSNTKLYFTEGDLGKEGHPDMEFAPNTLIKYNIKVDNKWPKEAKNIIKEAGIETQYRDIIENASKIINN